LGCLGVREWQGKVENVEPTDSLVARARQVQLDYQDHWVLREQVDNQA